MNKINRGLALLLTVILLCTALPISAQAKTAGNRTVNKANIVLFGYFADDTQTAADTYFIGKTGYELKSHTTTREDIARYNALDPAADEKQRRHRQRLDLRRKIKKGFIRIKERICK